MPLIVLHDTSLIYKSTVGPRRFGSDNWGKINQFDQVLKGPGVGVGIPFTETPIARSFRMVFVDGRPWTETPLYSVVMGRMARGEQLWRYNSEEALLHRLNTDMGALRASMQQHGFLSQERIAVALSGDQAGDLATFGRDDYQSKITASHNIKVGLNEDGAVLFLDGRHRLAMALALGLTDIPVRVVFRHHRWAALRETVVTHAQDAGAAGQGARHVIDHPDLEHLALSDSAVAEFRQQMALGVMPEMSFRTV